MSDSMSAADKVLQSLNGSSMRKAIAAVLPKMMNLDRFMQMSMSVAKMQANSRYVVDKASILTCVYNAAKYGLELNDSLGHAYLVPFKRTCTLIVGYKGLLELVRRSGKVSDIHAFIVYENDEFDYYVDEHGPHIMYRPTTKKPGKPVCGVSIARFTDSNMAPSIDVMPYDRIEAIKNTALARTPSSPWGNPLYEPEMAKKTVLRHHCKTLPMSTEASEVIDLDEKVERGEMPSLDMPDELKAGIDIDVEDAEFTETDDAPASEQPKSSDSGNIKTGRQQYNVAMARLVKRVGSESAREAIDEVVGKVLEGGPFGSLSDVPDDDDSIWPVITKSIDKVK